MIGAVLELGERRVHEVMVPRIDIGPARSDARRDHRDDRPRGPLAYPGLRGNHRQHRRHPLRQGPAPYLWGEPPAIRGLLRAALRPRVDPRRRPAPQPSAQQGPHRDRPRRVRRHGRPGHDRGPDRGDRRRDPGRVRRRGADDRADLGRRGPRRRAGRGRRPERALRRRAGRRATASSTTRSAGWSTTTSAACRWWARVEVDGLTLTVETTDGRRVEGLSGGQEKPPTRKKRRPPPRADASTRARPKSRVGGSCTQRALPRPGKAVNQ